MIADLAERQHGVVARAQLVNIGLGRRAIGHRLECGRLHSVYRGVYAVGHGVLSGDGRSMAAILVAGEGAALSHRSAAALWGIRPTARRRDEVTVARSRRSSSGVQFHCGRLASNEVTIVRGIPVTTVPRTLLDLAAVVPRRQVERAWNEAEVRRLVDPLSLDELVARYPGRRGAATIRAIRAAGRVGATVTRSELEERFLALLDDEGLPRPKVNEHLHVAGAWIEADCVWPGRRVIVELDGHASHATRAAFERDRARDRVLSAAGWRVVRITWLQLHDERQAIRADLRALLALRS
jgi:very-short-patch-repair endonuclease